MFYLQLKMCLKNCTMPFGIFNICKFVIFTTNIFNHEFKLIYNCKYP